MMQKSLKAINSQNVPHLLSMAHFFLPENRPCNALKVLKIYFNLFESHLTLSHILPIYNIQRDKSSSV